LSGSTLQNVWFDIIDMPLGTRLQKPRRHGLTMVMDKGLGLMETVELLSIGSSYFDFVKLAFGTSALYNRDLLIKKISLIKAQGIHVYPGGTFFEVAAMQNKTDVFLQRAQELGFSAIEISDGTISIPPETRRQAISKAADMGLIVLSEVGKKDPSENLSPDDVANQIKLDLAAGVQKVILEARESGKGIGIYNDKGEIKKDLFAKLIAKIPDLDSVIWEAPLKQQQQELILAFGPNVNLGNIPPGEILALESLRVGLRGDTLKTVFEQNLLGCHQ